MCKYVDLPIPVLHYTLYPTLGAYQRHRQGNIFHTALLQGNMEYIARGSDILPGCRYWLKEQTISARASSPKISFWCSIDHMVNTQDQCPTRRWGSLLRTLYYTAKNPSRQWVPILLGNARAILNIRTHYILKRRSKTIVCDRRSQF